jgi:hypothetical protein
VRAQGNVQNTAVSVCVGGGGGVIARKNCEMGKKTSGNFFVPASFPYSFQLLFSGPGFHAMF